MTRPSVLTFTVRPIEMGTPKTLLEQGNTKLTLGDRIRVFVVRDVVFDEDNKPLFSLPRMGEVRYENPLELYAKYPHLQGEHIFDNEHSLKSWQEEKN
jgi:hypothetical protein